MIDYAGINGCTAKANRYHSGHTPNTAKRQKRRCLHILPQYLQGYRSIEKCTCVSKCIFWRRRRDLNPRYPFGVYTISNRARSASYATSPSASFCRLAYHTASALVCQALNFGILKKTSTRQNVWTLPLFCVFHQCLGVQHTVICDKAGQLLGNDFCTAGDVTFDVQRQ